MIINYILNKRKIIYYYIFLKLSLKMRAELKNLVKNNLKNLYIKLE